VVVSGLPWSAFAGPTGRRLVDTIAAALPVSGVYTQFTYAATRWAVPGRRQMAQLRSAFEEVGVSRTVWRNFPPALVYSSRRSRLATLNSRAVVNGTVGGHRIADDEARESA